MTHDDLYPCAGCGQENLYPGPCEACGWDTAAVVAAIKPVALAVGDHVVLPPAEPPRPEPRRPVDFEDVLAASRWFNRDGDHAMTDPTNIAGTIASLVASVAARCPIACDRLTIGQHERADMREAGELMMLDWDLPGGQAVVDVAPEAEFVSRVGALRAFGAALIAIERFAPLCDDLDPWPELAREAALIVDTIDGGPEHPADRMALAARAAARVHLGRRGTSRSGLDWRGWERGEPESASRPEAVRPLGSWEFDVLSAAAFVGASTPAAEHRHEAA